MLETLATNWGIWGVLAICLIVMLILYGAAELVKRMGKPEQEQQMDAVQEKLTVLVTGKRAHGRIYYATFQTENGERTELELPGEMYGLIAEGDRGLLTTADGHFVSFEREIN